ncbi:protein kinase-like domain, concanavalin A-like lectin/glucanase domain protein [Tanacetum coccineum]
MNKGLESRQKPSNPSKSSNFIGRVKGLKVYIGNYTYECHFSILEDTTSVIDHHLGEVVFGKPFARKTGLVYDSDEGIVTFEKDNEKITFKMPHKMEAFNHMNSKGVNTDSIPPFVFENNDDQRGDGVAIIKRRRQDPNGDDVRDLATVLGHGRLKEDLESSMWRRR